MIIFIISLYFPKPMYTTKHTATYLYLETFVFSVGFFLRGDLDMSLVYISNIFCIHEQNLNPPSDLAHGILARLMLVAQISKQQLGDVSLYHSQHERHEISKLHVAPFLCV